MRTTYVVALALISGGLLVGCERLTTSPADAADVFDAPLPGLTMAEAAAFARGDEEFERRFAPGEGLGPIFNNASCGSCHSGDGRGVLDNALQRIGSDNDDLLRGVGGPQIQDKAIPGAVPETVPAGAAVSLRLPPPSFGVGLIEAIPDAVILALADPDDADGDGISGRPNIVTVADYVVAATGSAGVVNTVGRFGRKAQTASLLQQVAEAYHQDMGITTDFLPVENVNPLAQQVGIAADRVGDPELPASTVHAVTTYIRLLAPSAPGEMTPERARGRDLFTAVGCARCHVPELNTGPNAIAALSNKTVRLFSDLLLHDMGDELADNRPDHQATGREWKTPPLWGLRLVPRFLNGQMLLMHDGRARTIEEAILLHGGEGSGARSRFQSLTPAERRALIAYLESL
ncbi:MAG TPA: di-heme oxidoredictase family protein [Gemmatimonadaceae bacterium]|nr:di-heme oxidoredictase family protein [Gemmatimonadaceae bacterium]